MQIKNQILLQKIKKTGLSDKESLVYTALLELSGAFPSKIASHTGLNRTTVYDVLLSLSVKGLVNEIEKRSKSFYQIENPRRLLRYTKSKLTSIEHDLEEVESVLPDIEGLYTAMGYKPKVTYFEGVDGVLEVYDSHVRVSKPYEMLAWANADEFENVFPEKFFKNYRKEKERIGITTRGILPDTTFNRTFIKRVYENFKTEIIPDIRFIEGTKFPFKAEVTIYDENKVSVVNLGKDKLTGVIIEDPTIHGLMKMIFETSWKGVE